MKTKIEEKKEEEDIWLQRRTHKKESFQESCCSMTLLSLL